MSNLDRSNNNALPLCYPGLREFFIQGRLWCSWIKEITHYDWSNSVSNLGSSNNNFWLCECWNLFFFLTIFLFSNISPPPESVINTTCVYIILFLFNSMQGWVWWKWIQNIIVWNFSNFTKGRAWDWTRGHHLARPTLCHWAIQALLKVAFKDGFDAGR